MSRAYICLLRNDLDENLLQVLDLHPNSSQRIPSLTSEGQTGYLTWLAQNDAVTLYTSTNDYTTAAYKGLAAYLVDVVDNATGHVALTAAEANTVAAGFSFFAYMAKAFGGDLGSATCSQILSAIVAGGSADLDGTQVAGSRSVGKVEDVLRILSGEVYYIPANTQVSGAAHAFTAHCPKGLFLDNNAVATIRCASVAINDTVTIGNVVFTAKASENIPALQFSQAGSDAQDAVSLANVINDHRTQAKIAQTTGGLTFTAKADNGYVRLKASVAGTKGQLSLATLNATRLSKSGGNLLWVDGEYRNFRKIVATGDLTASALTGALSKLADYGFVWKNPAFTYGISGTAAIVLGGLPIGTDGVCPAVAIFDAQGNVIG